MSTYDELCTRINKLTRDNGNLRKKLHNRKVQHKRLQRAYDKARTQYINLNVLYLHEVELKRTLLRNRLGTSIKVDSPFGASQLSQGRLFDVNTDPVTRPEDNN